MVVQEKIRPTTAETEFTPNYVLLGDYTHGMPIANRLLLLVPDARFTEHQEQQDCYLRLYLLSIFLQK